MAKVVTAQTIGNPEIIAPPERKPTLRAVEAPPLEVKKDAPILDAGATVDTTPPDDDKESYAGEDDETKNLVDKSERFRKLLGRKHYAYKQAEGKAAKLAAELADSEEFAKNQYNRARIAEDRAAELEKKNGTQAPTTQVVKPENDRPNPSDKKYVADDGQFKAFQYAEDLAAFSAAKAIADDRAEQAKEKQAATAREMEAQASVKIEAAKKAHADWDDVVTNTQLQIHTSVLSYLPTSTHMGELTYYLCKNPDVVSRLNKLTPIAAVAEVGKLELSLFEKPTPTAVTESRVAPTGAPAPITPINASKSANIVVDPSKMDFKQLRAYERERAAARRRH